MMQPAEEIEALDCMRRSELTLPRSLPCRINPEPDIQKSIRGEKKSTFTTFNGTRNEQPEIRATPSLQGKHYRDLIS